MSFDSEERRGEGEAMTIRLGSPDFLRMFPTVVWTLQLDEETTRAINPGILRRVAEIRASAAEPSAGENWQSGHALHRRDEFHALVEAIHATTRKVLSFLEIASDDFEITGCWANANGIGRPTVRRDVEPAALGHESLGIVIPAHAEVHQTHPVGARPRRSGRWRTGLSCTRVGPTWVGSA